MTAHPTAKIPEVTANQSFISEVFHDLSQPLTALHCSLELALDYDNTLEQLRASVQTALENAQRLRERLLLVRALADAADPGDLSQPTDLVELLNDLLDGLRPVFGASGVEITMQTEAQAIVVHGNKARLQQALCCFLQYLLRYDYESGKIIIYASAVKEQAQIKITAAGSLPVGVPLAPHDDPEPYSCEAEMARRTFRAAGGEFALACYRPEASVWYATLDLI